MQIVIIIIVLAIVVGIIRAVLEFIGRVLSTIGKAFIKSLPWIVLIAMLVGTIVSIDALINKWGVRKFASYVITVLVLICSFCLFYCLYRGHQRKIYLKWIKKVGVGSLKKAPMTESIWTWAQKKNYTVALQEGYVASTDFCNKLLEYIDQYNVITDAEFAQNCTLILPTFQNENCSILLLFLKKERLLIKLLCDKEQPRYYTDRFFSDCCDLFYAEGGATEKEFVEICKSSPVTSSLHTECNILAKTVLETLVSCKMAHKVALPELGQTLYASTTIEPSSKMTQVVIDLDD